MSALANTFIVIATIIGMEAFAYAAHKYIMHGWGWNWHQSHHEERHGMFEKNDLYAVVFSFIAILLFFVGSYWLPFLFFVAIGVTCYGLLYFIFHDGLVHQRWPFRFTPRNGYLKRLVQAHKYHHATHGKDGAVSFGFLWAPPARQLKQELREKHGIDLLDK
jgi:beta-carotene 3-hydroxylase